MKHVLKTSLFVVSILAFGASAQAQTLAKVHQQMETNFKKSDTNKDGKLTKKEAKEGGMLRVAMGFARIDTQKRGYVTLPQLKAIASKRFKK